MALNLETEYPGRSTPADADYPYGSGKNKVSPVDLGTPVEKSWLNDIYGFLQALLVGAGITPSGVPDTVLASDYLDAANKLFLSSDSGALHFKRFDIGDWDMDADPIAGVIHDVPFAKIRDIRATIRNDADTALYPIEFSGSVCVGSAVSLTRVEAGPFDTADFNSTSYNRGWVTISYVD
jgi:hypothetical protein